MAYESEIHFTLDTVCPWTYLARKRLAKALAELPVDSRVKFKVHYEPYQLYPDASQEGEDKYAWYRKSRYGDSDEKMHAYTTLMRAYGVAEGIDMHFGGTIANTLHAHRLIQHYQEKAGADTADRIVSSLYRQYFEEERHPSSDDTLLRAALDAGVDESEARAFIADRDDGLAEVKMRIREQAGNQVDAVPYVLIEGKKRDHSLEGAREVKEYLNTLNRVIQEST